MDVPTCHLCGAALPEDSARCPRCGMHRAAEFGRSGYRRLLLGLASVYGLTALLVLATR